MQIFALCCLTICIAAGATEIVKNSENLFEELRDFLLHRKSNTDDENVGQDAIIDEKEEKRELDLRILQDLLSEDDKGLVEDIGERMNNQLFKEIMEEKFAPKLKPILKDVLLERDEKIREALKETAQTADESGVKDFFCLILKRNQPKFVKQLRSFTFLEKTQELIKEGCP